MLKDRPFSKENLKIFQRDVTIAVCQGCILKADDDQHIIRDAISVTRGIILHPFVENAIHE